MLWANMSDEERRDAILAVIKEGGSLRDLTKRLRVARSTMWRFMWRNGFYNERPPVVVSDSKFSAMTSDERRAMFLAEAGFMSYPDLAVKYQATTNAMKQAALRLLTPEQRAEIKSRRVVVTPVPQQNRIERAKTERPFEPAEGWSRAELVAMNELALRALVKHHRDVAVRVLAEARAA